MDDQEHRGAHLALGLAGQGLDGGRIGQVHHGFQLGQVGHQAGHAQGALHAHLVVLVDQPSRLLEAALQLPLRLARHADVDDGDGHADGDRDARPGTSVRLRKVMTSHCRAEPFRDLPRGGDRSAEERHQLVAAGVRHQLALSQIRAGDLEQGTQHL